VLPAPPVVVLVALAVVTSRNELPVATLLVMRRPLPFVVLIVLFPSFSLVLDASDLESSGAGRDFGGGMVEGTLKDFNILMEITVQAFLRTDAECSVALVVTSGLKIRRQPDIHVPCHATSYLNYIPGDSSLDYSLSVEYYQYFSILKS